MHTVEVWNDFSQRTFHSRESTGRVIVTVVHRRCNVASCANSTDSSLTDKHVTWKPLTSANQHLEHKRPAKIDSFYAWSVAGVGSGEMIEPSLLLSRFSVLETQRFMWARLFECKHVFKCLNCNNVFVSQVQQCVQLQRKLSFKVSEAAMDQEENQQHQVLKDGQRQHTSTDQHLPL